MRNQSCQPITYFLFAFILSGGLLGNAIGNYLDDRETERIFQEWKESSTQIKKDRVDSAIKLSEICLETKNPRLIGYSIDTAKMCSADAGGYGAERIQEIENKIKQKNVTTANQPGGVKQ